MRKAVARDIILIMKSILSLIILSFLLPVLSSGSFDKAPSEKCSCEEAIQEAVSTKQREGNTYVMMSRLWKTPVKNFTPDYEIIKSSKDGKNWQFWLKFTNGFIYMFELMPCNGKWYMVVIPPEEVLFEHPFPVNPQ